MSKLLEQPYPGYPRILNHSHCDVKTESQFHVFSSLPTELRWKIWQNALQQRRLIAITVTDLEAPDATTHSSPTTPAIYESKNDLGNIISGKNYSISIDVGHVLNHLFRVSQESRSVARNFYRVHVPYDLHSGGRDQCLYFNPEYDHIDIEIHPNRGTPELLADVVHDFRAADPKNRGILNLVVNGNTLLHSPSLEKVSPQAIDAFVAVISNLETIYIFFMSNADSRTMTRELSSARIRFNRSFPLYSPTDAFDLLERDPRPIDADLDVVSVGEDPKMYLWLWRRIEQEYGIVRTDKTHPQICFLISQPPKAHPPFDIVTCEDAMEYVRNEERHWSELFRFRSFMSGIQNPDKVRGLHNAPLPAVGFWLFDTDAFGEILDLSLPFSRLNWGMEHDFKLTEHRPRLGVFRLPPTR